MGILDSIFGGRRDATGEAKGHLDNISGIGHSSYDDYIDRGRRAGSRLEDEYTGLLDDPTALINKIMQNYHESEQYGYEKDKLGREIGASAAAGGVAGTPYHQQQQGEMVQGLLSKDMQQFLKNALGRYDTGLAGEKGFYDTGKDATDNLTSILTGVEGSKAGLDYEDAKSKNARRNALISALTNALGKGVGTLFGGPLGGAVGGGLGGLFGGGEAGPMSGTTVPPWRDPG